MIIFFLKVWDNYQNLEISIKPEIREWKTKRIENSLYNLMINMKCSEQECPNPASCMHKIDSTKKDLRCKDHFLGLKKNKSNYKEMGFYWTDIKNTLANIKNEVMQAQVLLSAVESSKFVEMLDIERLQKLEKIKEKLNRSLTDFEAKITSTKIHSDFDIFTFMQQQSTGFDKDIQSIYSIIGPFLAETYSSQILNRITLLEKEEEAERASEVSRMSGPPEEEEKKLGSMPTSIFPSAFSSGSAFDYSDGPMNQTTAPSTNETTLSSLFSAALKKSKKKRDDDIEVPVIGETIVTPIKVPVSYPTDNPEIKTYDVAQHKIVTIFAALQDDFKNQTEKSQNHIDFLFKLRDRYPSVRGEIDRFIQRLELEPSKKFLSTRVVANTFEIENLLQKYSIDRRAKITSNYVLDLDLRNAKKLVKFFQDTSEYQMPRIKKLNVMNVNRMDLKYMPHFDRFMSYTMASHILELYFGASRDCDIKPFNNALKNIMRKGYSEHSTIFLFRLNLDNEDLQNIFENIPDIRKLCFDECSFAKVNENFRINRKCIFNLEKLSLKVTDKKMPYLKYIAKAMCKTRIRKTLREIEINNPVENPDDVKKKFNNMGFKISNVKNLKFEDVFIL